MSDRTDAARRARGIDPRGPRFAAGITALLLLVDVFLGLTTPIGATVAERAVEPAFLLLLAIALLFLWGVLSPRTAPWGALYRTLVQPRLKPPDRARGPASAALRAGRRPVRRHDRPDPAPGRRAVGAADRRGDGVRRRLPQRGVRPVPRLPAVPGAAARGHRRPRARRRGLTRTNLGRSVATHVRRD